MIEVNNLGKKYGLVEAVKGVSFEIQKGDIVGLLGPNGAGKTTIMRILTCFMFPSYGKATVNNYDIFQEPLKVKRSIGYLPENAPVYTDLNVMEYMDFVADSRSLKGSRKEERIDFVIKECGLKSVVYKNIDELSKGFRQRVGLAQALIHDPEILIMDEPTTGLDPNQIIEIRSLIKKLGEEKTVILSTHILQEVEATCSRVLILNEGKIVAKGTTEEIGREIKGDTLLSVTFKGKNLDKLEDSLSALKCVNKVTHMEAISDEKRKVRLDLDPQFESEELVFDWAVKSGYKILSMVPERFKLEDIFIKLTTEGGNNGN